MKTLLYLVLLPLSVIGGAIFAQPLPISSGEHDGFSRLVIPLPENTGWSARDEGASARVGVDLENVIFDTTHVFDRISKTRLAAISQPGPGQPLRLTKNCKCKMRAFLQSGTLLVIDLLDPVASPGLSLAPRAVMMQGTYRFPAHVSDQDQPGPGRPALSFGSRIGGKKEGRPPKPASPPVDIPNLLNLPDIVHTDFLKLTESRLLEQIGKATDRGLLQPNGTRNDAAEPPFRPPFRSRVPERQDPGPGSGRAVRASADGDLAHIRVQTNDKPAQVICPAPEIVAIGTWADGRSFGVQVGDLRRSLFSEFDAVDRAEVVRLAKLYLYFGFGTEALSTLSILGNGPPNTDVLKAMARLFDAMPRRGPNPLIGQSGCISDVAFWSFLTDPDGAKLVNDESRNAILMTFAGLPAHLKSLLGPGLSEKFLSAGDSAAAEVILRAEDLASPEPEADSEMARAELELDQGQSSIARRRLEKVVAGNSEKSPEALVKWVEAKLAADERVAADVPELVSAFAIEYRGSDLGVRLRRAQAIALALSGDLPQSFRLMSKIAGNGETDGTAKTRSALLRLLSQRGENVTFLALALNDLDRKHATRPVDVGNAMARRFIDLGFPDAAERVLVEPVAARSQTQRRLMRAEIALARGLPNRAMVELAGLTGDAAQRLRARAMLAAGEYSGSADAFLEVSAPEMAARAYWLSGDLSDAASRGAGKFRSAAEIALGLEKPDVPGDPAGQLAEARVLLSQSEQARAGISSLLDAIPSESPAS